jgi:hypothetical protein
MGAVNPTDGLGVRQVCPTVYPNPWTIEMLKMPTHAGGVTFRKSGDRTLYLIVSSSDGAHWVLPKGHIEPGELFCRTSLNLLNYHR